MLGDIDSVAINESLDCGDFVTFTETDAEAEWLVLPDVDAIWLILVAGVTVTTLLADVNGESLGLSAREKVWVWDGKAELLTECEEEPLTETEGDAEANGLSDFITLLVYNSDDDNTGLFEVSPEDDTDILTVFDTNGEFVNAADGDSESFGALVKVGV